MKNLKHILLFALVACSGCGAGTLGRPPVVWIFPISDSKLCLAMDSILTTSPEYKIPNKWIAENDWSQKGYDFLESRTFYYKTAPEEMYYVTLKNNGRDSVISTIAIRAIYKNGMGWVLHDKIRADEEKRIEKRFDDEIIPKLERVTSTKTQKHHTSIFD